jgi:hypothetical protein
MSLLCSWAHFEFQTFKQMTDTYAKLVTDLYRDDRTNLYETLMGKEAQMLSLVNAVSNDERTKDAERRQFLHSSLVDIWHDGSGALSSTFRDLVKAHTMPEIVRAFDHPQRRLYVGLMLVFAALFLLLLQ